MRSPMIPPGLRNRIALAIGGGALAIAAVTTNWYEGTRYVPYADVGGVATVCQGVTGKDVIPGKTYTPGECATLNNRALVSADADVRRLVKVPISETEHAALIDFVYNLGGPALARSTLLRKLNAGDHAGACAEYRKWIYAAGKPMKGLQNRRNAEEWLCLGAKQ